MVAIVARHFGVRPGAIGYAGMKDKLAVTRQVISIHTPGRDLSEFPELVHDRVSVLWADHHANKLRRGHLRSNRFSIKIRGVSLGQVRAASAALTRLAEVGAPNRAGEQRFGAHQNNHRIGRFDLLGRAQEAIDELLGPDEDSAVEFDREMRRLYAAGDIAGALEACPRMMRNERAALRALASGASAERAMNAIDPTQRRFWVSAFQSAVFNRVLDERVEAGSLNRLAPGDIAWKHANGAIFDVDEETIAAPDTAERLARIEISPSGPMWGAEMRCAKGDVERAEIAALEETGVSLEAIDAFTRRTRQAMTGTRRALRVPITDPQVEAGGDEHGPYIRCAFELPPGAFATVVLREIMKPEQTGAATAAEEHEEE